MCMKVPGNLFKGVFKFVFYFILPYGIMATVPSQYIIGNASPILLFSSILTVVFFTAFAIKFWNFGMKNYKSASS